MRRAATALLALAAVTALVSTAGAEPTRSQQFFRAKLLGDASTSAAIKDLLRDGGGFVDRSIAFRDLTDDKKSDAIVRVHSGGAAGVVAVFVFSTAAGDGLEAVFRSQNLVRASTSLRKTRLSYRTSRYAPGDSVCCPSKVVETRLRWDAKGKRLRVAEREELDGPAPPAEPTPTPTPAPSPTPAP